VGRRLWLLVPAVLALAACNGGNDAAPTVTITQTETRTQTAASAPPAAGEISEIPDLVDRVEPSVVTILTDVAEGSGVIWNGDGVVVTNAHVVEGGSRVTVALASGARFPARVVAAAERFDLAVLGIDRKGLPAARFQQELPRVGELALAMGNPLGFEQSVTAGIISGVHRSIPSGGQTPALVDLIQTDAAISPGNSGGALVDGDGDVVGINVAYLPPTEGAVALGFAIPGATVVRVVRQLLAEGHVDVAVLGITPVQITPDLDRQFGLGVDYGAGVQEVGRGSGAARAGIRPGDVIVSLDGKRIETVEDLFTELNKRRPGERVTVGVVRDRARRTLEVRLGAA
jgi:S1-C subfamily serine protease